MGALAHCALRSNENVELDTSSNVRPGSFSELPLATGIPCHPQEQTSSGNHSRSEKCQRETSIVATATSVHSPNLNPTDTSFAKFKYLLRKAAARSAETVCVTIGVLRAFTPTDCVNYFRNSGYAQS
jgi:hypothetical protein